MRVPGLDSVAMIDHHQPAIAARSPLSVLHDAIGGSPYGGSFGGRDVDAGMKRSLARKGILPVAEMAQQPAVHRPDRGHGVLLPGSRISPLDARKTGRLQKIVLVDDSRKVGTSRPSS